MRSRICISRQELSCIADDQRHGTILTDKVAQRLEARGRVVSGLSLYERNDAECYILRCYRPKRKAPSDERLTAIYIYADKRRGLLSHKEPEIFVIPRRSALNKTDARRLYFSEDLYIVAFQLPQLKTYVSSALSTDVTLWIYHFLSNKVPR